MRGMDEDDDMIDEAAHLAQDTAVELGRMDGVNCAAVILMHINADSSVAYRVGSFVPNIGQLKKMLSDILNNMDGENALTVDMRKYKPEKDAS